MEKNNSELEYELKRLEQTLSIAAKQLEIERQRNEDNKSAIISAKQELREDTAHSIASLWNSEEFEALAELSQYANPITNIITDYEAVKNKIFVLENIIRSPYFARIDFKYDDEDDYEKIYIGRSSLKKDNSYEMDVHDWRSPIASVFYRFVTGEVYYDAPVGRITGEVGRKRQYEINNSKLEYFFDADVQIVDEFLRKLLSQNASSQMKTIVETIQKEQDIVIRDMENDLMMVQGVAGSGKTSIALHRAAYLMYQGLSNKLSANNIMIISPNTLFEQYISNVLPELGERNVISAVFEDIMADIVKIKRIQPRSRFLENLITSQSYRNIIKSSIEFKTSNSFITMLNRLIDDLPERWIDFNDVYYHHQCILTREAIKGMISERADIPFGIRLMQLEEFVLERMHDVKKERVGRAEKAAMKKELQKFTKPDVLDIYRRLFDDREYFDSLAKDILLGENIDEIIEYTRDNLNANQLYYDDGIVLTYLKLKLYGTDEYRAIKQVVIDEAQDYYPIQYEIFNRMFPNAKFTILGDINQTLEKQEDVSLYERIGKILNKKTASFVTMDKSFRCTNEILSFSLKFIDKSPDIKSFNRKGDMPQIFAAPNRMAFIHNIADEVEICREKGYRSIGLLCKTEKNALSLYKLIKGKMDVQLIKDESISDLKGVFIMPVYMSKGLEFDAVLICDADDMNYNSSDDKKLLYIACTRALHRLNMFCEGEALKLKTQ